MRLDKIFVSLLLLGKICLLFVFPVKPILTGLGWCESFPFSPFFCIYSSQWSMGGERPSLRWRHHQRRMIEWLQMEAFRRAESQLDQDRIAEQARVNAMDRYEAEIRYREAKMELEKQKRRANKGQWRRTTYPGALTYRC